MRIQSYQAFLILGIWSVRDGEILLTFIVTRKPGSRSLEGFNRTVPLLTPSIFFCGFDG